MPKPTLLLLLSLLINLVIAGPPAFAQSPEVESSVSYQFGEQITFQAVVRSERPVEAAAIFFQAQNDTRTNLGEVEVTQLDASSYQLTYTHQMAFYAIRPFAQVEFRWEIEFLGNENYSSPKFSFFYRDNRYDWQQLEEKPFRVFWYQGDKAFAQNILDTAQEGLKQLERILSLPAPESLDIYVYNDASALLQALNPAGPSWVSGHADPDLGIILVSIPAGTEQRQDIEQRIPHELAHISLFHSTGLGYYNLPTWLNEGLASLVEIYPNQDYQILLDHAIETDSLLTMQSLCNGFPRDASSALLAYAQAASFTRYIYDRFGAAQMGELVDAYANGVSCENGVKTVMGQTLTQLESQWRREALEQNAALKAFQNLLPWLVLLALTLGTPLVFVIYRLRSASTR
jgi:hypothetical protein